MADPEIPSAPALLLGPGSRPGLLLPLLRALAAEAAPRVRQLEDLGALLAERASGGFLLLDADELPLEDLGLVRRFLDREPADGWLLVLTGDDPAAPVARRLLGRARGATWLPWPVDVEELQALARGAGQGVAPPEPPSSQPPSSGAAEPAALPPDPERREAPLTDELRDDLERRLGRELRAIEAILRDEEGLLPEPTAGDGEPTRPRGRRERPGGDPLAGLELSPEEMEAFLGPLEEPLELPEDHEGRGGPAHGETHPEDQEGEPGGDAAPEARRSRERATATEAPPEPASAAPDETRDDAAPPSWYRAQVADLADLAQGLGLSLHALREANEEEGEAAVAARDEAVERLGDDVFRLIQFTRTLGFLAAPPGPGEQRLALATLVEEQLGSLAGSGPDSPRYLFRADEEVEVRCDKTLVVQALDAVLHVADACADATDVVRVGVHDGEDLARVRIDFPAGPAAGVAPARALAPYGLRRELPTIGPNALAAASRLFAGQGGRLSLGRGGPGRLVFEAELPKA